MERFNALSRGLQLMLVGSILLLIDSFFDWQHVEVKVAGNTIAEGGNSGWHGVGFIMGLLTIVLLVWLLVRLADVDINLPLSEAMTAALLAFLILLFTVIKFLADNEARHWPAWVGLILAILIAVGGWLAVQEAGGVDTLRTEASGMSSGPRRSEESASTAPPPTAAPTTPPAAPTTPPPASEPMGTPPASEPMGTPPPPEDTGTGEDRPI